MFSDLPKLNLNIKDFLRSTVVKRKERVVDNRK